MDFKELIRGILSILIVLGALASLFFTTTAIGFEVIRFLAGVVVGYYFGVQSIPLVRVKKKKVE